MTYFDHRKTRIYRAPEGYSGGLRTNPGLSPRYFSSENTIKNKLHCESHLGDHGTRDLSVIFVRNHPTIRALQAKRRRC